jgi:hypothetical protein
MRILSAAELQIRQDGGTGNSELQIQKHGVSI